MDEWFFSDPNSKRMFQLAVFFKVVPGNSDANPTRRVLPIKEYNIGNTIIGIIKKVME
jgi:hypothetical protein